MTNQKLESKISKDSLFDLFSQAPVAMALLKGKEMLIESANQQMLELWGKSAEIIGLPIIQGLPELSDQAFPNILDEVYTTGVPFRGDKVLCYLERNGQLEGCYFDFLYSPFIGVSGEVEGVSVVAIEVTSQVLSEQKLSESELRFKELLLNAEIPTAIYIGEKFVIEMANEKMLRVWGKTKKVIGKELHKAIPELEGQHFIQLLEDVYYKGKTFQAEEDKVVLKVDGKLQTFYYNYTYKPIRNLKGEIYGIINMAVDVTSQVNTRKALTEYATKLKVSEEMYKNLSEAMPQIVWTANKEGKFTYFNQKLEQNFGVTIDDINKNDFSIIIHPDDLVHLAEVWEQASRNPQEFKVEFRALAKESGEYVWLLARAVPEFLENGQFSQWVGSIMDIDELKTLQEQKDTFLGIASHELKTPLTSIKIYAQVLEKALKNAGDQKSAMMAKKMDEQVVKLTSLIGDLLDVTKINSGKMSFNEEEFEFLPLVEDAVREQQLSAKHKINLTAEGVGTVFADKNRISQVLNNLISNAIKYSPEAAEVNVAVMEKDGNVEVCVQDFGIGMPEDKQDKVFERYYRVSGDEQHTFPGLGLGLYIASEIIERSNGKIWVNSILGKGSTFCFKLPLREK